MGWEALVRPGRSWSAWSARAGLGSWWRTWCGGARAGPDGGEAETRCGRLGRLGRFRLLQCLSIYLVPQNRDERRSGCKRPKRPEASREDRCWSHVQQSPGIRKPIVRKCPILSDSRRRPVQPISSGDGPHPEAAQPPQARPGPRRQVLLERRRAVPAARAPALVQADDLEADDQGQAPRAHTRALGRVQ